MCSIHITNPKKPITADDLDRFEHEIGYSLPGDYREFLLKHNGGEAHPCDYERNTVVPPVEKIVVSMIGVYRQVTNTGSKPVAATRQSLCRAVGFQGSPDDVLLGKTAQQGAGRK